MTDEPQPSSLAPREGQSLPDPFEREYMKGEGMVLYRDKMVAGAKMNAAMVGIAAFMTFAAVSTGQWAGVTLGLPILALVWLLFGVLRVTVSEQAVKVKLGLFGPTIPMNSVESAIAIDYKWGAFGGWGIRMGPHGTMYNIIGDGGRAVKITWRNERGKKKVTFVGTRTADELATAINRGRRILPAAAEPKALEG